MRDIESLNFNQEANINIHFFLDGFVDNLLFRMLSLTGNYVQLLVSHTPIY
jgi:predicted methyltransferase MtxX (methanogen marker protein 4)